MSNLVQAFQGLEEELVSSAGGKGGMLARLFKAGYPVPDGFVILPDSFEDDKLTAEAWLQVKSHLQRVNGNKNGQASFAVRSSALSEDSVESSFAGEFETVLGVFTDEAIRAAIHTVRQSRHSERVRAYSQAKDMPDDHEVAVVVQKLVKADISGVLFTADPVSGSRMQMAGNFIYGFGERLVSGEAEPLTFTLQRPNGKYGGPRQLRAYARRLYRLASSLEEELGYPQDIEWAIADKKLYLLQSRPITTLVGHNLATGEWNDSLTGDYLWTRNNFGEARPDVMTPLTWSFSDTIYREISLVPGYSMGGNICGRYYANLSVMASLLRAMGQGPDGVKERLRDFLGGVPEELEIPYVPFPKTIFLKVVPGMIRLALKERQGAKKASLFLEHNYDNCYRLQQQLPTANRQELLAIWHRELSPLLLDSMWIMGGSVKPLEATAKLRKELIDLVGDEDTSALFSNLSDEASLLASLGPVVGIARVANGEMSRQEYLRKYGHRGPQEMELAAPRPAEDPEWLDRQLAEFERSPVDVDELLASRQTAFEAAWERFVARYPRKAKRMRRRIAEIGPANRLREEVRSEITRFYGFLRAWALRVGEVTGLGEDIFFVYLDELLELLEGKEPELAAHIPNRMETYERYRELPPYPTIIRGRFNAVEWAADPNRRADIYDATAPASTVSHSATITGFAGAAGRVEGTVRVLDNLDEGHRLQTGEILVAVTTNVGWTPLFPRAAAVITDVGAPLSHAAIVARELGVPAVVGCVDATTRLRTGDRVIVDGGRGIVEILNGQ